MKFIVVGDLHFKENNVEISTLLKNKIIETVKSENPDFLVILGDTLDSNTSLNSILQTQTHNFLRELYKLVKVYLMVGNHDLPHNRAHLSKYHSFTALKEWGERMVVVDEPIISFEGKYKFVFSPYVPKGRFKECLETLGNLDDTLENVEYVFAHQEFNGCNYNGKAVNDGDPWPCEYPNVIAGHIHTHQNVRNNIHYTGIPVQHKFRDSPDNAIEIYKSTKSGFRFERRDLHLPKKMMYDIIPDEIETLNILDSGSIRVTIHCTVDVFQAAVTHPRVAEWKSKGFVVNNKTTREHVVVAPTTTSDYISELKDSLDEELKNRFAKIF